MTPQERQLVAGLFDRLASLEAAPRDPEAERAVAEGLGRATHAVYALVQTALVQDEALKRANARIEEMAAQLESQSGGEPPRQGGFLDNMRDALLGPGERRGSVPSVRPGGYGSSGAWGPPSAAGAGAPPVGPSGMESQGVGQSPMGGGMMGGGMMGGGGGSFLGTAAASAAGVLGGAMMLNGIRSMFGHSSAGAGVLGSAGGGSPLGGSAANSDLARDAGIDHIGGSRSGAFSSSEQDANQDQDQDQDDDDNDTDLAGDSDDGDSDNA